MKFDKERPIPPGSRLGLLMIGGLARIESDGEVVLRAASGVDVSIGTLWTAKDWKRIEAYLESHPSPEEW